MLITKVWQLSPVNACVTCNAVGESHQGKTGFCGQPTLLTVSASDFIANAALTEEMFGAGLAAGQV